MQFLTIKRIIISALIILSLIWGVILFLVFTDSSYHLIQLPLPDIKGIATSVQPIDESKVRQLQPLQQDLILATGDGSSFTDKAVLVTGAATPSAILKNNELIAYFNYFPEGQRRSYGSIHQIKSVDKGQTWSNPAQIMIFNAPALATVPFSPKVVLLPNNKIKLYFLARKRDEEQTKLFAAVSDDGIKFAFDPSTSFELEGQSLISYAVTILDYKMHLLAYTREGSASFTAHHAISYDTSVFTRLADVVIKDSYYGQTSLVTDGSKLILYGASDKGLWKSNSPDGNSWSSINYLNNQTENPGLIYKDNLYYLFYTKTSER